MLAPCRLAFKHASDDPIKTYKVIEVFDRVNVGLMYPKAPKGPHATAISRPGPRAAETESYCELGRRSFLLHPLREAPLGHEV